MFLGRGETADPSRPSVCRRHDFLPQGGRGHTDVLASRFQHHLPIDPVGMAGKQRHGQVLQFRASLVVLEVHLGTQLLHQVFGQRRADCSRLSNASAPSEAPDCRDRGPRGNMNLNYASCARPRRFSIPARCSAARGVAGRSKRPPRWSILNSLFSAPGGCVPKVATAR